MDENCEGNNFTLKPGFWRATSFTYIYFKCPKGIKACNIKNQT